MAYRVSTSITHSSGQISKGKHVRLVAAAALSLLREGGRRQRSGLCHFQKEKDAGEYVKSTCQGLVRSVTVLYYKDWNMTDHTNCVIIGPTRHSTLFVLCVPDTSRFSGVESRDSAPDAVETKFGFISSLRKCHRRVHPSFRDAVLPVRGP